MSLVNIEPESLSNLKDKTELINSFQGATTGIVAAVNRQLTDIGSKVVWGDVAEPPTRTRASCGRNATSYNSVLDLFKTALAAHGRIDRTVYSAGVAGPGEDGRLFDTVTASPSSLIEEESSTRVLDVNLRGALFFSRVTVHHLRKSLAAAKGREAFAVGKAKRMTTTPRSFSSAPAAASPGSPTQMISKFLDTFASRGLMCNEPEDVSRAITHALASRADGETYYVAGSKAYEIEKRLEALRAQWLGEDVYRDLVVVQDVFAGA
ncbi:hypothetical protein DL765_004845 [Monosporascus sp. GIB2]|nr:hypothetical protein DL765_004845 [Monosporascus sp. GIB2]